ncbi:TlpA family protein disulfide reductase [Embleya scabrispora]|uniref:TlpA family protein disulfide reductase n=1 Tax=Embleya scabrispora TaxID=159449 RepID=UPI00037078D8|nr:TlpA disulfide reductase family protein [Embleya scabrispora]MYS83263.1 redoxin domain-containing protein [Streptomyces sp. SID5474]
MLTRRLPRRAALLTAAALLALSGCGGMSAGNKSNGDGKGYVDSDKSGIVRAKTGDRTAAPKVSGKTLEGKDISLADFKGKVVVLNVWGSWCPPCRAEAADFQQAHTETADKGVQFLGINTRDATQENALAFTNSKGITYPSLWDPDAHEILKFTGNLNPKAIPSTLIIDREGRIAARVLRAVTIEELRSMIDPVLNEPVPNEKA